MVDAVSVVLPAVGRASQGVQVLHSARPGRADEGEAVRVPLGVSLEYDALPLVGEPFRRGCQTCDLYFTDGWRLCDDGVKAMAALCPSCREIARSGPRQPLPVARVVRR